MKQAVCEAVWAMEGVQTAIISLYTINWLVFITETECLLRGTDWICAYYVDEPGVSRVSSKSASCVALITLLAGCPIRVSSGTKTLLRSS